jgi:hypothetical protein
MNFLDYLNNKNRKTSIISKGIKINNNFWNDFQSLLNNSDELAVLLGIPKNKIITWKKKIQDGLNEYKKEQEEINKKRRVIKTGKLN